jgi:hypothetical protein
MRNLARAAMAQALLHDLDVMLLLQQLLVEQKQQQSRILLEQEYSRFATTLTRGKRKLLVLYQKQQLINADIQDQFQSKWGVPPCLFAKFQKILAADRLITTDDIVNIQKRVSK